MLTEAEYDLLKAILSELRASAGNTRTVNNTLLVLVDKANKILDKQTVLAAAQMETAGSLAAYQQEVYAKIASLDEREAAQQAALRDMAQVVVGSGEVQAAALERVEALAREATGEIRTLSEKGVVEKKGAAAIVYAIRDALGGFSGLPLGSRILVFLMVVVAVVGWVLRGLGH